MFLILKDFCCRLGFVLPTHPWLVDFEARQKVKWREESENRTTHARMVSDRVDEIEKNKKGQSHE